MKKLLFIGHSYHQKTKSADFCCDLLAKNYEVTKFYFDPYQDDINTHFEQLKGMFFDVVVLWQIMPSLDALKNIINFQHSVFFPMYDGAPERSNPLWYEYRHTQIICFCRALHEELQAIGFSSNYVQYFPKPIDITDKGREDSVFFWQRINSINANVVAKLLQKTTINHLHFHKAIDPKHKLSVLNMNCRITTSEWFDTREEMQQKMQESALYIAPRKYEGIGMSFLEAMAMGRCVIAPNNPTMNEYIVDGKTGYLYDLENVQPVKIENIRQIQTDTLEYMKKGYETWNKEKYYILDWLTADLKSDEKKIKKFYTQKSTMITYKLFGFLPILEIRTK